MLVKKMFKLSPSTFTIIFFQLAGNQTRTHRGFFLKTISWYELAVVLNTHNTNYSSITNYVRIKLDVDEKYQQKYM